MAFSEYKDYMASELEDFFNIKICEHEDLFTNFKSSGKNYAPLQEDVKDMLSRIKISKSDNEATRSSLLVSHVLWKACKVYKLGIFFEPVLEINQEKTPNLPHQLNGKYDGALTLDIRDFVHPIVSVVEVKKSGLSDGLGQCLAEMYATLKKFGQDRVYGIITDGVEWEFLLLEEAILSIDGDIYSIRTVSDIVDRVGYIAEKFREGFEVVHT
jgi:hypothetical protein